VYAVPTLGSISHGRRGYFVLHASITVALLLRLASLAVLIYFIHHMARSIQLPEVIASIAGDLAIAIEAEAIASGEGSGREAGPSHASCPAGWTIREPWWQHQHAAISSSLPTTPS
jgi:uncharacterized membrane protein